MTSHNERTIRAATALPSPGCILCGEARRHDRVFTPFDPGIGARRQAGPSSSRLVRPRRRPGGRRRDRARLAIARRAA